MDFLKELWPHQMEGLERASRLPGFGFFFEMGTGKTAAEINRLRVIYGRKKKICSTLILGPVIVLENWKREFAVHSRIPQDRIIVLDDEGHKRVKRFDAAKAKFGDDFIVLTNYECIARMKPMQQRFREWMPKVLVLDESQKCKDRKSKQTKEAMLLSESAEVKDLLSGDPMPNGIPDLWSQFYILDGGATFGTRYWDFHHRFLYDKNVNMPAEKHFPDWQIRPAALDQIHAAIKSRSMAVRKIDVLKNLPPLVKERRYVEMTPDQARMYKEMEKDFITFVRTQGGTMDEPVVAELALTKALRLMQIASGYVKTEAGRVVSIETTPKMAALEEILREITPHSKALVWSVFEENYEQIRQVCEKIGIEYVEIHGGMSAREKQVSIDRLNNDPNVRVFSGHPKSGGIGINLTQASYSIPYSRSFDRQDDSQSEARNWRGGSEIHEKITRIDLVCKGTIEERVLDRLLQKGEMSARVLSELIAEF